MTRVQQKEERDIYFFFTSSGNLSNYISAKRLKVKTITDNFPIDPSPRSLIQQVQTGSLL